ncbi:MAG TPA: site-specific DNA-methyltransferase, partial [Candidatus Hydrogenedens sp.]|nr:site-specific DNA-methyltransferase [Candidatus Hydrogenedens sp.]
MPVNKDCKAGRNRTITLSKKERLLYKKRLLKLHGSVSVDEILNKTIHQDLFKVLPFLPVSFVDL